MRSKESAVFGSKNTKNAATQVGFTTLTLNVEARQTISYTDGPRTIKVKTAEVMHVREVERETLQYY